MFSVTAKAWFFSFLPLVLVLLHKKSLPLLAVRAQDTNTCIESLEAADSDGNGMITKAEYINMLVHLSPYEDCPSLQDMSVFFGGGPFARAFDESACLCREYLEPVGVAETCCDGPDKHIIAPSSLSSFYAVEVCVSVVTTIKTQCEELPLKKTATPSGSPSSTAEPQQDHLHPSPPPSPLETEETLTKGYTDKEENATTTTATKSTVPEDEQSLVHVGRGGVGEDTGSKSRLYSIIGLSIAVAVSALCVTLLCCLLAFLYSRRDTRRQKDDQIFQNFFGSYLQVPAGGVFSVPPDRDYDNEVDGDRSSGHHDRDANLLDLTERSCESETSVDYGEEQFLNCSSTTSSWDRPRVNQLLASLDLINDAEEALIVNSLLQNSGCRRGGVTRSISSTSSSSSSSSSFSSNSSYSSSSSTTTSSSSSSGDGSTLATTDSLIAAQRANPDVILSGLERVLEAINEQDEAFQEKQVLDKERETGNVVVVGRHQLHPSYPQPPCDKDDVHFVGKKMERRATPVAKTATVRTEPSVSSSSTPTTGSSAGAEENVHCIRDGSESTGGPIIVLSCTE